ncbi:hypothetical protein [Microbacterium aurantiacum]|mgnify:CR=1 FL=1|uniref:LPXTG-motif cell wall anchor domain-containing protein n=1 Tax=Microbacterium aurantiacum TaxID=162393 RepID=A0ABT8FU16_9MICO|nr:hypothetical protein [Microbacterium aurantiacum]MBN9201512.1 hypothetical protein [Microbacterium chocolatum]MDN4464799.1 hypothetical protein [Microbacterium aurantiacum]ODT11099.1 MAG: hypothetical protein ABS61_05140 [Microbacterium sp. SCN 70-18]
MSASPLRRARRVLALSIAAALAAAALVFAVAPAATAATQGAGFGAWQPTSTHGWHGSMRVGDVHTYCILPGIPLPTGTTSDHGVRTEAAGLSPQQLTGINLLVTRYGQTEDPVQAAAVGWAVKAIADWETTLRTFGYRGDSLAGAIDWTFSRLAPAHNARVQELALAYYAEGSSVAVGVTDASGSVMFLRDDADPLGGAVRVDASTPDARGTLILTGAVFADDGTTERHDVVPGEEYAITVAPAAETTPGRPLDVSAQGRFRVDTVAAVRHFTTPGGQDTAGPAGPVEFEVSGHDTTRHPLFFPTISTVATASAVPGESFVDDVTVGGDLTHWPRTAEGDRLPVRAHASVYRLDEEPGEPSPDVPEGAVLAGELSLETLGEGPARVVSSWTMDTPGWYVAVWSITRQAQSAEVAAHLATDAVYTEAFASPTQITRVESPPPPIETEEPAAPDTPVEPIVPPSTAQLAETGSDPGGLRGIAGISVILLTAGLTAAALVRRRRFGDAVSIR